MKFILLSRFMFILFIISYSNSNEFNLKVDESYYYEEKYFRILSNNYDSIDPGNFWSVIDAEENDKILGVGFAAKKDFGSLILLKDWSMYNFKLTKIIFRKCSFEIEDKKCKAEMLLYHTKDNGYYPPGRRIFIKQNFFVIVVPFFQANDDNNPSNDLLFNFLNLGKYTPNAKNITPIKPVKLYQIIQNQPSYLFEGKFEDKDALFMVFTQYHFISKSEYEKLESILNHKDIADKYKTDIIIYDKTLSNYDTKLYRNMRNSNNLKQKVSLMIYSKANYLNNILLFFIIFLI